MYVNIDRVSERHLWLGCYPYNIHDFLYKNLQRTVYLSIVVQTLVYGVLLLYHTIKKNGTVYSFEPNPKLIERLEKQREINKVQDIWKIIPTAVSSDNRTKFNNK